MDEKELAQIPYVVHEYRMWEAYKRERRLKISLIVSNVLWAVVFFFFL